MPSGLEHRNFRRREGRLGKCADRNGDNIRHCRKLVENSRAAVGAEMKGSLLASSETRLARKRHVGVIAAGNFCGATIAGTQVHSVRLPSFVVSTEVVFAAEGERLSIRHDAGETPAPYVAGTLLAIRAAPQQVGLIRGLDQLLD
jgi:dihydrodipicolinate reductase